MEQTPRTAAYQQADEYKLVPVQPECVRIGLQYSELSICRADSLMMTGKVDPGTIQTNTPRDVDGPFFPKLKSSGPYSICSPAA